MDTKSKVDYQILGLRATALLAIIVGLFLLLQSVMNFKDVQYYASEVLPESWTTTIIDKAAGYMENWVYSGTGSDSEEKFMEIYGTKTFEGETSDFLLKIEPLKKVIVDEKQISPDEEKAGEEQKAIIEAMVSHSIIQYLNKGYRFFIAEGDKIVYQDNDLVPRDLKTLETVDEILKTTPKKQMKTGFIEQNSDAPALQTFITIADIYYADYSIGLLMIFFAGIGFVLCMFGLIMLERLGGKRVLKNNKKTRYFDKGFIETMLAVFLVAGFNIVAIVYYLWNENHYTDYFESGKAELLVYIGASLYIILTLWTITKVGSGLNIAEENANILKKMKADLIANVSHDMKTPLTSIIGYIELLEQEESLSNDAKAYVEVLKNKSERLKNIISDLFDLSLGVGGNNMVVLEKLDLTQLLHQAMAEMEDKILKSGFEIKKDLPEACVFINADGNKIYRVFQNLLDNALKYSLSGTPILVSLNTIGKKASLVIQNTSSYEMRFDEIDVLEKFVRADHLKIDDGIGLGLSIAETFAKACGGELRVKIDGDQFKVIVEFKRV